MAFWSHPTSAAGAKARASAPMRSSDCGRGGLPRGFRVSKGGVSAGSCPLEKLRARRAQMKLPARAR
eukprot:5605216-Alexandrium_andersonii.AAC.1